MAALAHNQPHRPWKVLMSFELKGNVWQVNFWDTDRRRSLLPRQARFASDEALVEFAARAGASMTLEDKNILAMMMQRKSGEIALSLTPEQYATLQRR